MVLEEGLHLSLEGDCVGLALGADASRPWQVAFTAWLDLTACVLQPGKLPSVVHMVMVGVEEMVGKMLAVVVAWKVVVGVKW